MPTYRVSFAADENEPRPDVARLAAVEAESTMAAVERIVSEGALAAGSSLPLCQFTLASHPQQRQVRLGSLHGRSHTAQLAAGIVLAPMNFCERGVVLSQHVVNFLEAWQHSG